MNALVASFNKEKALVRSGVRFFPWLWSPHKCSLNSLVEDLPVEVPGEDGAEAAHVIEDGEAAGRVGGVHVHLVVQPRDGRQEESRAGERGYDAPDCSGIRQDK